MITIFLNEKTVNWDEITDYYSEGNVRYSATRGAFSQHFIMFSKQCDADEFKRLFPEMIEKNIVSKNSSYTIFIDLDGVLSNFEKLACELNNTKSIKDIPKNELWTSIKLYNNAHIYSFFYDLELMEGAMRLVEFICRHFDNVYFLTATGTTDSGKALVGKIRWCKKHFAKYGIKPIIVQASEQKALYADKTCVLVDDSNRSIKPWIEAGGVGILHKNIDDTIKELKGLI